jgi:hypothetical protein
VSLGGDAVEQIDGMVQVDHITCMIEAKDQSVAVNVEPLAKLRNQLMRRSAGVIGFVFSFSGFTEPARTLAQFMFPQAILLWTGEEIAHLLGKRDFVQALKRKYQYFLQMGMPDYDIRAEYVP